MTRLYAILNSVAIGADLIIERAGTVLTHAESTDLNRKALSVDGKTRGIWRAEWYAWGEGALADSLSVGIARPTSSLSTAVGADEDSYGYRVGEGQLHHDGSSIASVTVGAKSAYIGLVLDLSVPSAPQVAWMLNGVLLDEVALPDDGPWHLAATVCGSVARGLRVMQNTGQRRFAHFTSGWYAERESLGAIRVATRGFVTPAGADQPHVRYRGLLSSDSRLSMRERLHFWPMGNSSGVSGAGGSLRLDNADGALDHLVGVAGRGALVRVQSIPDGGGIDDAEPVGMLEVDVGRPASDGVLELRLRDRTSALKRPLQDALLPPDADPTTADTVMPVALGAVRMAEPKLLNGPTRTYLMHDAQISAISEVLDGGWPLDPGADPADYQLDARGRLVLERDPYYRITADIGVDGSVYAPPETGDILGDEGNPFSGTPTQAPDGWTRGTYGSSPDGVPSYIGGGQVSFPNGGTGANCYLLHVEGETIVGEQYRIELVIDSATTPGEFAPGSILAVSRSLSDFDALLIVDVNYYSTFPQTVVATFIATSVHPIYITWRPIQQTSGTTVISKCDVRLIQRLDVTDDDALPALGLEAMLREMLVVRGGLAESDWVAADAAAIDAETGYAGTGLCVWESVPIEVAVQSVLDSYCACLWRDVEGRIRIARMRKPTVEEALGTIGRGQMIGDLLPREYAADAFTTQQRGRRNWRPLVEGQMTTETEEITPTMRARLTADYRISVASAVNVAPAYVHGVYAEPHNSLLDRRADLQAEADYVSAIHAAAMAFYDVEVAYSQDYALNQTWLVDYVDAKGRARYGLEGRPCVIVDFDPDPLNETMQLTLLG
jgi:hypothetical protein